MHIRTLIVLKTVHDYISERERERERERKSVRALSPPTQPSSLWASSTVGLGASFLKTKWGKMRNVERTAGQ